MNHPTNQTHLFPDFQVNMEIDGIKYKTALHFLCESDVVVKISEPPEYQGILIRAPHIPYFAMQPKRRYIYNGSMNEKTSIAIKEGIIHFHDINRFFRSNKEQLTKAYLICKLIVVLNFRDTQILDRNQFIIERDKIRYLRKTNEIDKPTYRLMIHDITIRHKLHSEMNNDVIRMFSSYLRRKHGIVLSIDDEDFFINRYLYSRISEVAMDIQG